LLDRDRWKSKKLSRRATKGNRKSQITSLEKANKECKFSKKKR
jgi:hypothetical protein